MARKPTEWHIFAQWVRAYAKAQRIAFDRIEPYPGFWVKAARGRIRSVPEHVLRRIERVFHHSRYELAEEAGVSIHTASRVIKKHPHKDSSERGGIPAPEHQLAIVWSSGVPDHMWPVMAQHLGYFAEARIQSRTLDAESAGDFPSGYAEALRLALPALACAVAPWSEVEKTGGWPIAVTHRFTGYALVTRAGAELCPLTSDSPREYAELVDKLARRRIAAARVGCVTQDSIEFLKLACELGARCGAGQGAAALTTGLAVAEERTPSMLQELHELGAWGWDLAVGHALTYGLALQNPQRYSVLFDWERLSAIAAKAAPDLLPRIERLAVPVALLINREPAEADRALVCRLWAVAARAAGALFCGMTPALAAEHLQKIGAVFPPASRGDAPIDAAVFSRVWSRSYRGLSSAAMLSDTCVPQGGEGSRSLRKALGWVRAEKSACEKAILTLRGGAPRSQAMLRSKAERLMAWGDYFDAARLCEKLCG